LSVTGLESAKGKLLYIWSQYVVINLDNYVERAVSWRLLSAEISSMLTIGLL